MQQLVDETENDRKQVQKGRIADEQKRRELEQKELDLTLKQVHLRKSQACVGEVTPNDHMKR